MLTTKKVLIRIKPDRIVKVICQIEPKPLEGNFWQYTLDQGKQTSDIEQAEQLIEFLNENTEVDIEDLRGWEHTTEASAGNSQRAAAKPPTVRFLYEDDRPQLEAMLYGYCGA